MKLLIADDHQLFLEGLKSVLMGIDAGLEIETAGNGKEALDKITADAFDVVLLDLRLPVIDGFSLLVELTKIQCLTPVIVVTASEDPRDEQKAIDLGALGFIPKSSSGHQIKNALHRVLDGEIVRPASLIPRDRIVVNEEDWADQHKITRRQLEVLRLIRHGMSNQAIADELFLSIATVKTHIVAIFQALGTQSRTEAIQKAQILGLD